MRRLILLLALATTAFGAALALYPVVAPPPPAQVVIEGVVLPGDTYRVDPLGEDPAEWPGEGLDAIVRLVNKNGEAVEATTDGHGRFRLGPIELTGHEEDLFSVTCADTQALCLTGRLPEAAYELARDEVLRLRWRITLPPRAIAAGRSG